MSYETLGYGEDFLSYCLLDQKRSLCDELEINPKDIQVVFYRPSFGRGKWYGEFDAILGTAKKVFLIESKNKDAHSLDQAQIDRHKIFREFFKKINSSTDSAAWRKMRKQAGQKIYGKKIPGWESDLARNLVFVIRRLKEGGRVSKEVINVLVCFDERNAKAKNINLGGETFKKIVMARESIACLSGKNPLFYSKKKKK